MAGETRHSGTFMASRETRRFDRWHAIVSGALGLCFVFEFNFRQLAVKLGLAVMIPLCAAAHGRVTLLQIQRPRKTMAAGQ
jgi:hypothetical protein